MQKIVHIVAFSLLAISANCQHSVARQWNELLLEAIRNDYARPTVHARNLCHISAAMYDAWAAYEDSSKTYFLGKSNNSFFVPFTCVENRADKILKQNEAISYSAYRLLKHRFQNSPGKQYVFPLFDSLFYSLGYDSTYTSINYSNDTAAALGNYIADQVIKFGLQDGANEINQYENQYYTPANAPLIPSFPGNSTITHANRWQPLSLKFGVDQSGNPFPKKVPDFLSPEWGNVSPFSLNDSVKSIYSRDGNNYNVFYDPLVPPKLDSDTVTNKQYKWSFSLVSIWSSHLDPKDSVMWDISPASIGNLLKFPSSLSSYDSLYNLFDGGDGSAGRKLNPSTGLPYTPQIVPRADYARVLAEFWADGPNSETPPGHWFTLLNSVNDHPQLIKKWNGKGKTLSDLEWDIKSYFTLGGAMHDAAISAWSIKGWYDYIRPISAIRYMAQKGQSSDTSLPNYHDKGIPLYPGFIELISPGDPLQGNMGEHIGKIKLYTWCGPDSISNSNDIAGVNWIRAENWWPYQRPNFVTPPFAGYISGHSTYSRAAAEILTNITGDAFFPGGMGEFVALKDSFLVFEEGPSVTVKLQWATYRDASDQCSLSRIWGGIHPPADDISGRKIGKIIGKKAFHYASKFFETNEALQISTKESLCNGDSITIGNKIISEEGIYFDTLQNVKGCDSILIKDLKLLPVFYSEDSFSLCKYNPFTFHDNNSFPRIFGDTFHISILNAKNQCDSIVKTNILIEYIDTNISRTNFKLSSNQDSALYQWFECTEKQLILGANNQFYEATKNGNYAVQILLNGCLDTSQCVQVTNVGINSSLHNIKTIVYPNPFSNTFIIKLFANSEIEVISPLNTSILSTQPFSKGNHPINLYGIPSGIYYLKIKNQANTEIIRIVKN